MIANMRAAIEHILSSPDAGEPDGQGPAVQLPDLLAARLRADVCEALSGDEHDCLNDGDDSRLLNDVAAYLDRQCTQAERDRLIGELACCPQRRAAVESAAAWLEDLEPESASVPADLLTEAAAAFAPEGAGMARRPRSPGTQPEKWLGPPAWAGIAAVLMLGVIGSGAWIAQRSVQQSAPMLSARPPSATPTKAASPAPAFLDGRTSEQTVNQRAREFLDPRLSVNAYGDCDTGHDAEIEYRRSEQVRAQLENNNLGADFYLNRDPCERRALVEPASPAPPPALQPRANPPQSSASRGGSAVGAR